MKERGHFPPPVSGGSLTEPGASALEREPPRNDPNGVRRPQFSGSCVDENRTGLNVVLRIRKVHIAGEFLHADIVIGSRQKHSRVPVRSRIHPEGAVGGRDVSRAIDLADGDIERMASDKNRIDDSIELVECRDPVALPVTCPQSQTGET